MQPYLFPYIGYWQLIASVDQFIILDDVNYINRGWINRNRLAVHGKPAWMTLPLTGASQNKLICDIEIAPDNGWKNKTRHMINSAYGKAPEADTVFPLLENWLTEANNNLSLTLYKSLKNTLSFLDIKTTIIPTSSIYPKDGLKGQHRILDICKRECADVYVNLPGGLGIYDAELFRQEGIELQFLQPNLHAKSLMTGADDGSVLSIIDHMMHNPRKTLIEAVAEYSISVP